MTVCEEADLLVNGERQKTYGSPTKNFERIAALWNIILGCPISADQVGLCMTAVKLARLIETPTHRDSQVDACGYIACLERMQCTDPLAKSS